MIIELDELGIVLVDPNNTYVAVTPREDCDDYVDIYLQDLDVVIVTYMEAFTNYLNGLREDFSEISTEKYLNLIIQEEDEVDVYEGELPEFITLTEYLLFEHK